MAQASVEITKFAAFYNEGERGARGGAASNDKVWGIAVVNGTTVNFWGRRNGVLKFKTFPKGTEHKAAAKYAEKIGGRTSGDVYTPVTNSAMRTTLCPSLEQDVRSYFYSAMSRGTLNTRH